MDWKAPGKHAIRALSEAEMGEAGIYYGMLQIKANQRYQHVLIETSFRYSLKQKKASCHRLS